jgi:long-chain fatty acid transport protein
MTVRSLIAAGLAAAACAALAPAARAGGLARPNVVSARGVALGGAFTAIADDTTAWYYNPAGAAWADDAVSLGLEAVYAPRSYTPLPDSTGAPQPAQKAAALAPVPTLGVVIHPRTDGVPSRLAVGAGIWNVFGGQISFDKFADPNKKAVNSSTDLVFELGAGVAYEVDDVLAIGGDIRMGLGLFSVDASANPIDSTLSAVGVGVGANLGVMLRPVHGLQLGATWRSGMNVSTQGSGTTGSGATITNVDVQQVQRWPQVASLGAAVSAGSHLRLSGQVDWTQWSKFRTLLIEFPGTPGANQTFDLGWQDTWTYRAGAEWRLPGGAVRVGGYYDTNAVPDRSIERQYLDNNKKGVSAGGSGIFGKWRVDGAIDFTLPGTRTVPDNSADYPGWPSPGPGLGGAPPNVGANTAPGDYYGYVVTIELALARSL